MLISRLGLLGIKPANFIRFSGVITPSERLLGRRRTSFGLNVRNCYKCIKVLTKFHFPQFSTSIKSRDEISFRGKDCNTRILRPLARRLRAWSYYFHNLVIWTHNHLNKIYHSLSLSLTLTLSRDLSLLLTLSTSSPSLLGPKLQILPSQSISTAKEAQIDMGNHLLLVFHLGVVSFSSFSCKGSFLKVRKLVLSGLIILGCVKRFPLGQSSSYESLY